MSPEMWSPLTVEGVEVFGLAVHQCLHRWTALQLAIHNGWSGSSLQQFQFEIVDFFTGSKEFRDINELEGWLDDRMEKSFGTHVDDGSIFDVAEQIMIMHEECMFGNYENVRHIFSPASVSGQSVLNSREEVVQGDEIEISIGNQQVIVPGDEEGMDIEQSLPTAAIPSSSPSKPARAPLLTEEEMADGWQEAPVRRWRRGKTLL